VTKHTGKIDCYEQRGKVAAEIGDLDRNRNLKIRTFVGFVLTPVFRDLQPALRYRDMGASGVTPMQYYQDVVSHPRPHGYGDEFDSLYQIRLCRSVESLAGDQRGEARLNERLILETRATLTGKPATAAPTSFGFEPELAPSVIAGTGRVLHVLTRPEAVPERRRVHDAPPEIDFLAEHPFEGSFPTIALLRKPDEDFSEIDAAFSEHAGLWGVANSDVFQHVNAREYIFATENAITAGLFAAGLPLERLWPTRAQVIFRRPSFVGQHYRLRVRSFRRDDEILSLAAFHPEGQTGDSDERASVFLRFEGRFAS
jgi:hypothetical protein